MCSFFCAPFLGMLPRLENLIYFPNKQTYPLADSPEAFSNHISILTMFPSPVCKNPWLLTTFIIKWFWVGTNHEYLFIFKDKNTNHETLIIYNFAIIIKKARQNRYMDRQNKIGNKFNYLYVTWINKYFFYFICEFVMCTNTAFELFIVVMKTG